MKVILYNGGRNLNRAIRTCFSFGVTDLYLVGNSDDKSIKWELKGNLYSAKEKVKIHYLTELPELKSTLAMENFYSNPLNMIDFSDIDTILIGGESCGLPRSITPAQKAIIPTVNNFCLTVEAALAITLYHYDCWQILHNSARC